MGEFTLKDRGSITYSHRDAAIRTFPAYVHCRAGIAVALLLFSSIAEVMAIGH